MIDFELSFQYENESVPALRTVSGSIKEGSCIVLCGGSGRNSSVRRSGSSTGWCCYLCLYLCLYWCKDRKENGKETFVSDELIRRKNMSEKKTSSETANCGQTSINPNGVKWLMRFAGGRKRQYIFSVLCALIGVVVRSSFSCGGY